ncbi:hypothetical protein [Catellatospora vulcania]|uniref:hypothetical protein n=1 Tax=Catellatospora vulcania TaxID=1460450 RepID=UPI0012D3B271|nr:hypothetical protein [Catellatospora vulcania]
MDGDILGFIFCFIPLLVVAGYVVYIVGALLYGLAVVVLSALSPRYREKVARRQQQRRPQYVTSHGASSRPYRRRKRSRPIRDSSLNVFETQVYVRLLEAGMKVEPQWVSLGYRIDFAVRHPTRPGIFVLAIEADGATYHSSPEARMNDGIRQERLEEVGWRFHRVLSTDWWRDRDGEIEKVRAAYNAAVAAVDACSPPLPAMRAASASEPVSEASEPTTRTKQLDSATGQQYQVGNRVRHHSRGVGSVVAVQGVGTLAQVKVNFARQAVWLLLRDDPLELVADNVRAPARRPVSAEGARYNEVAELFNVRRRGSADAPSRRQSLEAAGTTSARADSSTLSVGEWVTHPSFGRGQVVATHGYGAVAQVRVDFGGHAVWISCNAVKRG